MEIDNPKVCQVDFKKQQQKDPWNLDQRRKDWEGELKKFKQERNIVVEVEPKGKR